MKPYHRIKAEVAQAVEYVRSLPADGSGSIDVVGEKSRFYPALADYSDDTVLEGYKSSLPRDEPNEVTFSTPKELTLAFTALGQIHGRYVSDREVLNAVRHEWEHGLGARAAGFRRSVYGLFIEESTAAGHYAWYTYHACTDMHPARQVTKLAIATIIAAPTVLSRGDRLRLRQMGYTGSFDVAIRAAESASPLAVPASALRRSPIMSLLRGKG